MAATRRKFITERDGRGGGYLQLRKEMGNWRLLLQEAGTARFGRNSSPEYLPRRTKAVHVLSCKEKYCTP